MSRELDHNLAHWDSLMVAEAVVDSPAAVAAATGNLGPVDS